MNGWRISNGTTLSPYLLMPGFKYLSLSLSLSLSHTHAHTHTHTTYHIPAAVDDEFPSDTITETGCTCPEVETDKSSNSNSETHIVGLISVFIVLCIIAIAIGGVLLAICFYNMRGHLFKVTDERDNGGGRFSEERDMTKTPNSYSCNSPDSAHRRSRKDSASRYAYL